jgi:spermidine/putrescine transport system permease protein
MSLSIRSRATKRTRQRTIKRVLSLTPAMVMLTCFMLIPLGIVVVYSFLERGTYGGVEPAFSLEAYRQLVFERDFDNTLMFSTANVRIFWRSLWLAFATMALSLVAALPVAYYIARQPKERKNTLVLLITIPFWTNLLIRTFCWILILRDTGLINQALQRLNLIDEPVTLLFTNGAVLVGLVYSYLPFMVLPLYASLEKLDIRLLEAAHDLYASRWRVFRRITLPLAMPGIVAGCTLVFIPSLGAFITPQLLGGGKNLMLGSLIQMQFSSSRNWPFGAAMALMLLTFVLVALLVYVRSPAQREGGLL